MNYESDTLHWEPKTVRWWKDPRKVVVLSKGLKTVHALKTGKLSGLFSAKIYEETFEHPEPLPEIGVRYTLKRTVKFLGRRLVNPFRKMTYWPGWPGDGVINLP